MTRGNGSTVEVASLSRNATREPNWCHPCRLVKILSSAADYNLDCTFFMGVS
jgi:hypothetical protein